MNDAGKRCELCGNPVIVVGKTTQHYEPKFRVVDVSLIEEVISELAMFENEHYENLIKRLADVKGG